MSKTSRSNFGPPERVAWIEPAAAGLSSLRSSKHSRAPPKSEFHHSSPISNHTLRTVFGYPVLEITCRCGNPPMTVTADAKKRVVLPVVKPGDSFDVQISGDGRVVLTKLVPAVKPDRVRLVKKHGYTVAIGTRPITQEQVRRQLHEFP